MNDAEIGLKADFSVKNHLVRLGVGVGDELQPPPPLRPEGFQNNLILASDQTGQVQFTTIFFNGRNRNSFIGIIKLIQAESIVEEACR